MKIIETTGRRQGTLRADFSNADPSRETYIACHLAPTMLKAVIPPPTVLIILPT